MALPRIRRTSTRRNAPLAAALVLGALAAGSTGALHAQTRPALAAREVAEDISVDGRLDEPAWAAAAAATGFRQLEPSEGAPASQATEVRVLYGPGGLYVGALLRDADPSAIERTLGRRDDFNRADWFFVSIDAYLDRRTAYTFGVNAAGVQFDGVQSDGGGGGPGGPGRGGGGPGLPGHDESWDAIWTAAVRATAEGWVAEIEIPYSMLRFPRADSQTWGIQFSRHIPRLGEEAEWPLVPRAQRANRVARFADLTGLRGIEPQRNVQVRPYSLARLQTRESLDDPGSTDGTADMDVGGDLKLGFGSNITLDATINPDFGQVESDPAVLNLTAFETVFEERRPFFLEGSQIYEFSAGPGRLLYTRRIGADAPIIAAGKISGRTGAGLSFGLLGATTGHDFDPDRQFGVARVSQQLGASTAGGILTLFDGPAAPGRARSLAAGADWDLRLRGNRFGIEGFAALTRQWWTEEEIEAETGFAAKVWGRKRQGAWQGFVGAEVFSDDFDPNDVGQLRSNNAYVLIGSIEHEINDSRPFGPFQRASAELFGVQRFAYVDRLDQGLDLDLRFDGTLRGFQTVEASISVERPFGGYDLFETRGAGPWAAPATLRISGEVGTDQRRSWQLEPEGELAFQRGGGRAYTAGLRGEWNASDRLSLGGRVDVEWERDFLAWSSNETFMYAAGGWWIGIESGTPLGPDQADYVRFADDGLLDAILAGVQPIGADRYFVPVFGARDTRAADLTLRGTYTLTPGLSVQLYGQLFAAEGRYDRMRILRAADDLAGFDPFPKREEFALGSLQSNAVLRWEYRPGSTLYAVWTHGRRRDDVLSPLPPWGPSPYDRSLGDQIGDTFAIFPENVFLVKLSYTFLNR